MSIEVQGLSCVYSEGTAFEKRALDDIHLTIADGEFLGIIGHTGSGKSTLIQHFNALMKPTAGKVLVDGEDIHADKSKLKSVRQKIGLVFQYPEHQLFEMTVYKDVAFGPENLGLPKDEVENRVREATKLVGIPAEMLEKSPFELSGGQKRRVAIAGVLAMHPRVLVLDEPAAGLDPRGRDEILQSVKEMHATLGITVVLVSHSMEDIAKLVDRIIVMNKGRIAITGSPADVFGQARRLEEMGLAAPQAAYLLDALRGKGFNIPEGLFTTDAAAGAILQALDSEARA